MEKALGRTNALVVAISILVIAFRAGTQTSPYLPVGPAPSNGQPNSKEASSPAQDPRGSAAFQNRRVRILTVTPAPLASVLSPPEGKGARAEKESGQNDSRPGLAQQSTPVVCVKQSQPVTKIRPSPQPPKVDAGPADRMVQIGTLSPPPRGQGLASAKIVNLRAAPADKPDSNMPKEPEPVKASKPRFLYPDAVSPYHPAPVPVTLAKPNPKPAFNEVVRRVIEDPANKGRPLAASRYFQDKPAKKELNSKPEPNAVKLEESKPAAEILLRSPKEIGPALDHTKTDRAGPVDRLPDVLPDSPSISLVQAKYESEPQESAGTQLTSRGATPKPPTLMPVPAPPSGAPPVVRAKYKAEARQSAPAASDRAAAMPKLPAPVSDATVPNSEQAVPKIINHEPELETPALPLPIIVTPNGQAPQPSILPGAPSELRIRSQQPPAVRTIILIPQATKEPAQDSVQPKASDATSAEPEAPAEVSKAARANPRSRGMPTPPAASKQIPEMNEGTLALSEVFAYSPNKLPASIADSALVLGPANELLESKRAAAQLERLATPEAASPHSPGGKGDGGEGARATTTLSPHPNPLPQGERVQKGPSYFEKWLKDYIQTACGEEADGLAVALDSGNRLQVRFRVKNDADGERIGRKIIALPELARYQVSFDIDVLP